jgi:hypothetical protein
VHVTVDADEASTAKNCNSLSTPSSASSTTSSRVEEVSCGSTHLGQLGVLPHPVRRGGVRETERQPEEVGAVVAVRQ